MCLCVCLTFYRLGPWTWYKLKTSIIRTIRAWTRDFQKKFPSKWPVAKLPNKNFMLLMLFYAKIFYLHNLYIFFAFILNGSTSSIYIIISLFCLCVCVYGYRLGSWISHKHETGIIRSSMIWKGDIGQKFSRKVTSG